MSKKIPVRRPPKDEKYLRMPSVSALCIELGGFKRPMGVPFMVLILKSPDGKLFGVKILDATASKPMWQYCTTWYFKNRRQARYWQRKEVAALRENKQYVIESLLRDTLPAQEIERADTDAQQPQAENAAALAD